MKKTLYISSVVVIALVVSGYFVFAKRDSQKYNFRFDKVSKGDMSVYVTATGTISPVISVDVGTQVSGIVTKLYADFNSVVRAGQVIAKIDTTFLYQSMLDAQANLDRAKAQYADSKRTYDREKGLYDKGLESEQNYSSALAAYESNAASLKSAASSLDRARINLAYATIYAPIDGVVVNRAVNVGQTVAASFSSPTLFTIANDLHNMQIQTTVDESDIGRVSIGQKATFTVDAYPDEKFTGTVSQIRLAPQSIQNVVNYIVIIDVKNDQLKLMPGMTANVNILVASASDVMKVSNMALRFQPPSDIIDTTGMGAFRGGFMGRRGMRGGFAEQGASPNAKDTASHRPAISTQNQGTTMAAGREGGFQRSPQEMARFKAIRDSIEAAHGGKLGQDELRAEMRKLFANRMSARDRASSSFAERTKLPKAIAQYGIESKFPEYEKGAYDPTDDSGRGRVWILKPNGQLQAVFVRTGLNDGRYTEISSPKLSAGDEVVLGASANGESESGRSNNPLAGGGGMRFR